MKMGIMTGARARSDDVNEIGRTITVDEVVALTRRAEAAGFDNVWMANVFSLDVFANVPLKRMGGPDDAAGVGIFLASRASAFVTGAMRPVDGGVFAGS